jgi:very-short-patch-repair endonuclease
MKSIERPFYYGASTEILARADKLRKNQTGVEKVLWKRLKGNRFENLRFRRQHPIAKFIVDFYCHELLLVVELDGSIHNKEEVAERDEGREIELKKLGLTILRFTNDQVIHNMDKILNKIRKVKNERQTNASPLGEDGWG